MSDIKDYTTNDPVTDNSELSLQVSNGVIILFPILALFCINMILPQYRNKLAAILFLTILEGMFSVANHMYHHDTEDTAGNVFQWLDVIGVIALGIISFLLIFDIFLYNPINQNFDNIKLLYRVFYTVTLLFMLASYAYAQIYKKREKTMTEKQRTNIYNQYHNIWHMGGAMLIVITILYTFTFHITRS